ncbi:MAG: hypothetical protein KatS3mg068_2565 [Candidatus Sericytochromatia bacterium]|nr:MAG: hypothetical protein KatS3mg068_2565 [Candidatus Sericytochromatia bacterium]
MKKYLIIFISLFLINLINSCDVPNADLVNITENKNSILIEGIIHNDKNEPEHDVIVIIKDDNKILAETKTNSQGKFSINVPKSFSSSYIIEAKKDFPNYTLSQTIIINSGEKANFIGSNSLKRNGIAKPPVPTS